MRETTLTATSLIHIFALVSLLRFPNIASELAQLQTVYAQLAEGGLLCPEEYLEEARRLLEGSGMGAGAEGAEGEAGRKPRGRGRGRGGGAAAKGRAAGKAAPKARAAAWPKAEVKPAAGTGTAGGQATKRARRS